MTKNAVLAFVVVAAAAAAAAASIVACVDRRTCYTGEYLGCTCNGGARGYQMCAASEDGYGACVCDGKTPGLDASASDAADVADAGAPGFLGPCTASAECEGGVCFDFSSRGLLCTKPCTQATAAIDCPPPSPGCNGQNVCRAP